MGGPEKRKKYYLSNVGIEMNIAVSILARECLP
jgi:hypothetical protein